MLVVVFDSVPSKSVDRRLVEAPVSTMAIPYLISASLSVARKLCTITLVGFVVVSVGVRCVQVIAHVCVCCRLVRPVEEDKSSTAES